MKNLFLKCFGWIFALCIIVLHFSDEWKFALPCNVTAVRDSVSESFFWNNLDFYGIVAVVLSLFSLWYTFRAYVSQSQTENNTRNVPIKDQVSKFCDLNRHEYRNLVVAVSTAVKFFAEANRENGARISYPSESHVLKLQAAPEDFVLDINPEMAATVSEMRLLLRNYNIEISVACDHLTRRSINDEAVIRDYDNLIYKPLFLVRKACNMEAKLNEEGPLGWGKRIMLSLKKDKKTDGQKAEDEKARVRLLLSRSMEIMVYEHLTKLSTSLPKTLGVIEENKDGSAVFGKNLLYLKMISATAGLDMDGIDHTDAMKRSFEYLYDDEIVEGRDREKKVDGTLLWTWRYKAGDMYKAEKTDKALKQITSCLPALKRVAPDQLKWLDEYSAALVRIGNEEQIDFVQFFPLMLRMDVIAELKNIGMVDFG